MEKKESFQGRASLRGIVALFFYFGIILILGLSLSIYFIVVNNTGSSSFKILNDNSPNSNSLNQYNLALFASIFMNMLGCSIYYIRKLYKLSLSTNFLMEISSLGDKLENLGTVFYFLFRPIFSIAFTILIIIGIKGGMITVAGNSIKLSSSFTDLCMFLSFFVGFSTGKFLSSLEEKSNMIIGQILNNDNKNISCK